MIEGASVNVKDYGALGDGTTDDTASIQAAIDAVIADGGGSISFNTGTFVVTSLDVRHGLMFVGNGASTITRPDNQGNWYRTFTTQNDKWDNTQDSDPLIFKNLIIDGNRANQGTYTGYELEQAHMIFLNAETTNPGRLRVIIDGCTFKEGCADAVEIYKNTDVTISNCFFDNIFRGGIVCTGGWTKIRASNCIFKGDTHVTGIDLEVDGAGYNSSKACDIELTNLDIAGDFDLGVNDESTATISNINCHGQPFNMSGKGKVRVSNSKFYVGVLSGTNNRIVAPWDLRFDNCEFILTEPSDTGDQTFACAHVYWQISGSTNEDQRLVFDNCVFGTDGTIESGDTAYGIYANADKDVRDNRLIIKDCEFKAGLDQGVHIVQGGTVYILNSIFDSTTAMWSSPGGSYSLEFYVDGITITDNVTTYHHINSHGANQTYRHKNVFIDEDQNILSTSYGVTNNVYEGSRIILADTDPSSATNKGGLLGDIWQLKTPVAGSTWQWVCTSTATSSATWKALTTAAA